MYDFPIIPIIIFSLMIVPPVVIGFFRGWKASLFILIATLAFVGIEIGISFAIYDSLWDLLNRFVIQDLQQGLSKDALKEVGKSTIIILFIGICLLPTYGLVMALYFPINKKLRRHLFPDTEEINQHQKNITRSVHWMSRTSGMIIAATSGLFFAASASSAAASIFTPLEKRTKFTDFTSDLARLYTFGNGANDESLQIVNRFAKNDLTVKYQEDLSSILYFGQSDVKASIISSINEMSIGRFHDRLLDVSRNDASMLAVVNLIINSNSFTSRPKFFLKDTIYKELNDDGTIDQSIAPHVLYDQMETRLNSYSALPSMQLHLNESIIKEIQKKIKETTLLPYEQTGYYKQWEDGANFLIYLKRNRDVLISREEQYRNELRDKVSELSNIYNEINSLKSQIIALGVTAGVTDSYKYVIPQGNVQTLAVNANGIINRNEQELAALEAQVITAQGIFDSAKTLYDSIKPIDDSNELDMKAVEHEKNTAMSDRDDAQTIYNDSLSNLKSAQDDRARAQAIINRITTQYLNRITSDMNNAKSIYDSESVKCKNLSDDINSLKVSKDSKYSQLQAKQNELSNLNNSISSNQQIVSTLTSEISSLEKNKISLESQIRTNNSIITNNNNKIGQLNPITDAQEITRLQAEIGIANNNLASLNSQLVTTTSLISTKNNELSTARGQIVTDTNKRPTIQSAINTLQSEYNNLESQINTKNNELNNHKNIRDTQYGIYLQKQDLLTKETQALNDATTNKAQAIADINTYTQQRDDAKTDLDNKIAEYNIKLIDYNHKKKIYDDYHNNTYTPALNDMNSKESILNNLKQQRDDKQIELNNNITKKQSLITDIQNKVDERASKITEIYSTSDDINAINSRIPSAHTGENHQDGASELPRQTYTPKQAQTSAYTNWALNTIPGINDYISRASVDTQDFKGVMESERIEYKRLEDQYLAKIAEILRS